MKIAVSKALNTFCTLFLEASVESLDTNKFFLGCFHMFQTDNPEGAHWQRNVSTKEQFLLGTFRPATDPTAIAEIGQNECKLIGALLVYL